MPRPLSPPLARSQRLHPNTIIWAFVSFFAGTEDAPQSLQGQVRLQSAGGIGGVVVISSYWT